MLGSAAADRDGHERGAAIEHAAKTHAGGAALACCDVAIVGAGPAGAACARRLAQDGCRVVLLERTRFDVPRVGESLPPGVQPLLADLGVWPRFLALQPLPSYGTRSVWGGPDAEQHSHLTSPWGCGWHVDRLAFDWMLAEAARLAGARLLCGTTTVRCDRSAGGWDLDFLERRTDGCEPSLHRLHASVVIDATGRAARLGPCVGGHRFVFDRLVAVATRLSGIDITSEGYVMVESAAEGWWYTAPVPNGGLVVMLMTDSDLCRRAAFAAAPALGERLQSAHATRTRVTGGFPSWGPRVFSAISQRLRRKDGQAPWLAIGDAALAVDPISGSGVVRALRSAHAGAAAALTVLEGHAARAIETYESARDHECATYLNERAQYYGMERRWCGSTFWQRRATPVAHADWVPAC